MVSAKDKEKVTDDGGKGKRKWRSGGGGADDDKTGRKRKNRAASLYIEDAAYQVDDDEYSSDDSSLGSGFFDEELDSEFIVNNEPGKASHLPHVKEEAMSEEEYKRYCEERYKSGAGFVRYAEDGHDDKESMDRDRYVPSAKDPTIWKVKCMIGRERYSALCLMQKYADMAYMGNMLQIISACALDHVKGFIVIEANNQHDIYEACKGLSTIYSSKVTAVPSNEISRLLSVRSKSSAISEGMWARVFMALSDQSQFIPQPELSEVELRQVESAYALEDRSWTTISKGRRVCAMGKFSMNDDKERLKAIARSKKEKAKGKEAGSSCKRKETESVQAKRSKHPKKSWIEVETSEVEPIKKKLISGSVVVGLPADKGKELTPVSEPLAGVSSGPIRMKEFLEAISKAFLKSSYEDSIPPDSNQGKLLLSFNRAITASYGQFEVLSELDSIERPLKDKVAELLRRLEESEAALGKAKERLKRDDAIISELRGDKIEADEAIRTLTLGLEAAQSERDCEVGNLRKQIAELQDAADRSQAKIDQLMIGEGLDLEAFIDSEAFAEIKDCIEDSTGDELIRRIKEVYPELDLAFLTAGGSSSPHDPRGD